MASPTLPKPVVLKAHIFIEKGPVSLLCEYYRLFILLQEVTHSLYKKKQYLHYFVCSKKTTNLEGNIWLVYDKDLLQNLIIRIIKWELCMMLRAELIG